MKRGRREAPTPLAHLLVVLRFFSRLPISETRRESELGPASLAQAAVLVPLAGAIIGAFPATVIFATRALGLPSLVVGALAVATLVLVTGGLHEDGLADCADGFGGGATRERKLAIMRDSRIGTYGACALVLALLVRAAALGAITARSPGYGAAVAIAAAALSRTACMLPLMLLNPARTDGIGAATTRPSPGSFASALVIALLIASVAPMDFASPARIAAAIGLAGLAALTFCALAKRQIGGQTGDVAGATQQLAEIAVYIVFAAA